jgi:hypothetical protein
VLFLESEATEESRGIAAETHHFTQGDTLDSGYAGYLTHLSDFLGFLVGISPDNFS